MARRWCPTSPAPRRGPAMAEAELSVATAEGLPKGDPDGLREPVRAVPREVEAEVTKALGAAEGERSAGRLGARSGNYGRTLITRVGELGLRVPQDRDGHVSTEPSGRCWRPTCLVAERYWDEARWAIEAYAWRFEGLERAPLVGGTA